MDHIEGGLKCFEHKFGSYDSRIFFQHIRENNCKYLKISKRNELTWSYSETNPFGCIDSQRERLRRNMVVYISNEEYQNETH